MKPERWFLFDLGNVVIKLAYERVLAAVCANAAVSRNVLVRVMEQPGGYRDLERGGVTFEEFHEVLVERSGYRGTVFELHEIWCDFFDGPIEGIEELLDRVRKEYRVAYLSNSNPIHAELIPRRFAALFSRGERFFFSHELFCAKPDPAIYARVLELLGASPSNVVFVDDLLENVLAARELGIRAFQFTEARAMGELLEKEGLLAPATTS